MISLCLTNFNRLEMLLESFKQVINDYRISEIVISDDCSDIEVYEKIKYAVAEVPKIKLYRNESNIDCYFNKKVSVELATNEWVILFDSDNIISKEYIDCLFDYNWNENTAYMPSFAAPQFNYKEFSNDIITKENVSAYIGKHLFGTMMNCMNYFVNRNEYLKCWDGSINPHTADSIYMNYKWLQAGNKIFVVPNLFYIHRIHNGSHYKNNVHKTGNFYKEVEEKLKQLS